MFEICNYESDRLTKIFAGIESDFSESKMKSFCDCFGKSEPKITRVSKNVEIETNESPELKNIEIKIKELIDKISKVKPELNENKFRVLELEGRKLIPKFDSIEVQSQQMDTRIRKDINQLNDCSNKLKTILMQILNENIPFIRKKDRNSKYEEFFTKAQNVMVNTKAVTIGELDDIRVELIKVKSSLL